MNSKGRNPAADYTIGIYIRLSLADEDTGYGSKSASASIANQRTRGWTAVAFGLAAVPRVFVGQGEADGDGPRVIRCRLSAFSVLITFPP